MYDFVYEEFSYQKMLDFVHNDCKDSYQKVPDYNEA